MVEKSPFRTVATAYRRIELYNLVPENFMEIIVAQQVCHEAGMFLPDPMDISEAIAIFRDENDELLLSDYNTGLQRVFDTDGRNQWIATSNLRKPELFWNTLKDHVGFETETQWFPRPRLNVSLYSAHLLFRENLGLCLHRDYDIDGGTTLEFDVCDRRNIANFLCENDNIDFALRTYLNNSLTGFDIFLGKDLPWTEQWERIQSINFTSYVDVNLTNYWNALVDNQNGLSEEERQLMINRKPRRITEAAEQCKKEGTTLLTTKTLNNEEQFRQFFEKVDINWFWVNGFQDNYDGGNIKEFDTQVMKTLFCMNYFSRSVGKSFFAGIVLLLLLLFSS